VTIQVIFVGRCHRNGLDMFPSQLQLRARQAVTIRTKAFVNVTTLTPV